MEIEAPEHAVAVWLEGEEIMVRFPNRHLVKINTLAELGITLRARQSAIYSHEAMTVGTNAAPVQYDIDAIAAAMKAAKNPETGKSWDDLAKEAGARIRDREEKKRERLLKEDTRRQRAKQTETFLQSIGLGVTR